MAGWEAWGWEDEVKKGKEKMDEGGNMGREN